MAQCSSTQSFTCKPASSGCIGWVCEPRLTLDQSHSHLGLQSTLFTWRDAFSHAHTVSYQEPKPLTFTQGGGGLGKEDGSCVGGPRPQGQAVLPSRPSSFLCDGPSQTDSHCHSLGTPVCEMEQNLPRMASLPFCLFTKLIPTHPSHPPPFLKSTWKI